MPPPPQQAALYKDGRIDLTIQAYKRGEFTLVYTTALAYEVPRTTLRDRLKGMQPKLGFVAINRLLTHSEEDSLVQWVLSMDSRDMPPTLEVVRRMASLLVS